ncbi:hypothetical protein D3C76_911650 [compost metagenome]
MVDQGVDVGGHVHGDHIGRQTVDHRPRLLARTAEGHLHVDLLVVLGFPVLLEGRVVVLVEVAHHVVGNVEQGRGGLGEVAEGQARGEQRGGEELFHVASLLFEGGGQNARDYSVLLFSL